MSNRSLALLAAVVAGTVLIPAWVPARAKPPTSCPPGRFLVDSLLPLASTEPVVISGKSISIGTACPPVTAKLKGTKRGQVKVTVVWAACAGVAGKASLNAVLQADCNSLSGTFVARKAKIRKTFTARRSSCGDGVVDRDGNEECDGASGCDSDRHCADGCVCLGVGETTTTSTSTTTLPVVSFSRQVQPILTSTCAIPLCHEGPHAEQGMDLRPDHAYRALVGVDSVQCPGKRVEPGQPDASYLVSKLDGSGPCFLGALMPSGGALSPSQIDTIRTWISQGARDN